MEKLAAALPSQPRADSESPERSCIDLDPSALPNPAVSPLKSNAHAKQGPDLAHDRRQFQ